MIQRSPAGRWQIVIADLSLLLFIVTLAGLQAPQDAEARAQPVPTSSVALAHWRDAPGGPSLRQWLAEGSAGPDGRLALTITYRPGALDDALAAAVRLRREAGAQGDDARIVLRAGHEAAIEARLVQDRLAN